MARSDPWPFIHTERAALAADLEGLSEEQWQTASLCDGWTVRDVLAHLTATAKMTPPKFLGKFIGSGFKFHSMSAKDVAEERGTSGSDALRRFKDHLKDTSHPPGPIDAMVGEAVIHGEDIRRPLGISHTYGTDGVVQAADFYKKSNLLSGAKNRIAGLTLRATDAEWSTGSGPEVSGPAVALLCAMTGRRAALPDLAGDGLATLTSRM